VASTNRTAVRGAGLPAAEAPGLDPRATLCLRVTRHRDREDRRIVIARIGAS